MSNLMKPRGHTADELFHSPAFIAGFSDYRGGRAFSYPQARGPHSGMRSSQIAYERGRHFAALWAGKPLHIAKMIAALSQARKDGFIL